MVHSHIAHFYALAAPDFVVGPGEHRSKRNILGVIKEVGLDIGKEVIKHRAFAQRIQEMIGGKATHPVCGLPGGMSKPIDEAERKEIEDMAISCVDFAKFSIDKIFTDVVLKNPAYLKLVTRKDLYYHETYYAGMVDKKNRVNFYDGDIRVVDPAGKEFARFAPRDYLDHIGERVQEWTYLKFPYLKKVGWKGLVDGPESGLFRVNSLARLNVADGMATPGAQEAFEHMYETLGGKPVHHTLAFHWARLIEILYASERMVELAQDPDITSTDIRTIPTTTPDEGVGCVEAPRGTLYHHYWTDDEGMMTKVNLIVATGQNYGPMNMSIKRVAEKLIRKGKFDDGVLNMVEMAFRAYDPCLACATHELDGRMRVKVDILRSDGSLLKRLPDTD
jgi:F420-non-reducing hydrogenase large subunit